jgi:hypothetical protein
VKPSVSDWITRKPSPTCRVGLRVVSIHIYHFLSPAILDRIFTPGKKKALLLRMEPHFSSFNEKAPCGVHPGCRTKWSLLMLLERLPQPMAKTPTLFPRVP